MSESKSCLINKLSHYVELSKQNEDLLASLEKTEQEFRAGEEIYSGGSKMKNLYVVKSGWLIGYTLLPDGGRHVVRIYHSGDIIGFPALAFKHHEMNLQAANAGCLCPFEKQDLDEIFETSPRITALLFTLSSREQVILIDTLRASSRMKPVARLAFLIMDIVSRLRITNPGMGNRLNMPLTQYDLGDAVGLTNVTVSRTLTEMEDQGLIERSTGTLTILNEGKLREICDFHDRNADMDTSWFPGG